MRHIADGARLAFASKAVALAKMKKEFPELFRNGLPIGNPLPDSYTAAPAQLSVRPMSMNSRTLTDLAPPMMTPR